MRPTESCHLHTTSLPRLQHCLSFPFWHTVPPLTAMITVPICTLHQALVHPSVFSKEQEELGLPCSGGRGGDCGSALLPSSPVDWTPQSQEGIIFLTSHLCPARSCTQSGHLILSVLQRNAPGPEKPHASPPGMCTLVWEHVL